MVISSTFSWDLRACYILFVVILSTVAEDMGKLWFKGVIGGSMMRIGSGFHA